jgi:hypothetical protein
MPGVPSMANSAVVGDERGELIADGQRAGQVDCVEGTEQRFADVCSLLDQAAIEPDPVELGDQRPRSRHRSRVKTPGGAHHSVSIADHRNFDGPPKAGRCVHTGRNTKRADPVKLDEEATVDS